MANHFILTLFPSLISFIQPQMVYNEICGAQFLLSNTSLFKYWRRLFARVWLALCHLRQHTAEQSTAQHTRTLSSYLFCIAGMNKLPLCCCLKTRQRKKKRSFTLILFVFYFNSILFATNKLNLCRCRILQIMLKYLDKYARCNICSADTLYIMHVIHGIAMINERA